jgi:outer membrane protein OmpA-like peptidoglycan-associated protein
MMRDAVKNGKADPSQLALLEDRVALGQGKKQIYGSQIIKDPVTGKDTIAPIEDFANVDKRRAEVGLEPLEEYVSHWGIVLNKKDKKGVKNRPNIRNITNDIEFAKEIKDSIIGPVNVSKGFGLKQDYSLYDFYFEGNTAWFKLKFDVDTILTFDIVPVNPKADYDFMLFKCPNSDCIDYIRNNKKEPERRCHSYNLDNYSSTGLSEYYTKTVEGGGFGPGYVSSVAVKAGETFYLMIDYGRLSEQYEYSEGFTLYMYNYWPAKPKQLKLKRNKVFVAKKSLVLENVLFESGKSILLKESYVSLDKLVNQLQTSKTMKIEISGYTDNIGDEIQNQMLSEERAKAVVDYLISKKIERNRLSFKGFGSKQPIASNETEEGRKKNRRVEFVVLSR